MRVVAAVSLLCLAASHSALQANVANLFDLIADPAASIQSGSLRFDDFWLNRFNGPDLDPRDDNLWVRDIEINGASGLALEGYEALNSVYTDMILFRVHVDGDARLLRGMAVRINGSNQWEPTGDLGGGSVGVYANVPQPTWPYRRFVGGMYLCWEAPADPWGCGNPVAPPPVSQVTFHTWRYEGPVPVREPLEVSNAILQVEIGTWGNYARVHEVEVTFFQVPEPGYAGLTGAICGGVLIWGWRRRRTG